MKKYDFSGEIYFYTKNNSVFRGSIIVPERISYYEAVMLSPSEARSVNIFPRDAPSPRPSRSRSCDCEEGSEEGRGSAVSISKTRSDFPLCLPERWYRSLSRPSPLCFVPWNFKSCFTMKSSSTLFTTQYDTEHDSIGYSTQYSCYWLWWYLL